MSTVLYKDNADDIKEKGYVAISHVWGNQEEYEPEQLGIKGGINWKIPLSDPDKISRIIRYMTHFEKEYCWFDVLCMPQDRQEEINREISLMGDYYSGAVATFALSSRHHTISDDLSAWYDMMTDVIKSGRDLTKEEHVWIHSCSEDNLLDVSEEQWFKRVWTFQEAVLSKNFILIGTRGDYVTLRNIVMRLVYFNVKSPFAVHKLFRKSSDDLGFLGLAIGDNRNKTHDLAGITTQTMGRKCYRPHDKFYGILGVLGYKDFFVDYNISMKDLNKKIIQHAYSKGDVSWVAIGGGNTTGFIQPMYKAFPIIGEHWKEEKPGICDIAFEDETLRINTTTFATVICCKKFTNSGLAESKFAGWTVRAFRNWGFDDASIACVIMGFLSTDETEAKMIKMLLDSYAANMDSVDIGNKIRAQFSPDDVQKYFASIVTNMGKICILSYATTIVKSISQTGKNFPLIICGNADIGDEIKLVKIHDEDGRTLGIVSESGKRKGVCLYKRMEMSEDIIRHYTPYKFLL